MITADPLILEKPRLTTPNTGIFTPQELYGRLLALGIGARGQNILDLGTGTGVLPRNLAPYGAHLPGQTFPRSKLSRQGFYPSKRALTSNTRRVPPKKFLSAETFDTVTACQCFFISTIRSWRRGFMGF